MGACPSADATVKPLAARPVLLSYTNAAPTVIKAPRIIPNKIRMVGVSLRLASLTRTPRYGSAESDKNMGTLRSIGVARFKRSTS
jgi:hypothetical protein